MSALMYLVIFITAWLLTNQTSFVSWNFYLRFWILLRLSTRNPTQDNIIIDSNYLCWDFINSSIIFLIPITTINEVFSSSSFWSMSSALLRNLMRFRKWPFPSHPRILNVLLCHLTLNIPRCHNTPQYHLHHQVYYSQTSL